MKKIEYCVDIFLDYHLTNTGKEVYKVQWHYLWGAFLLIVLFFPRRFLINFLIILLFEPQIPLWNPMIPRIRDFFLTYETTKKFLAKISWGAIGVFYYFNLHLNSVY